MREFEGNDRQERRSYGPATEKPVKEGEEHEVTIDAVGSRGDGIAKVNNFVIFVPGVQAGQTVRVRITSVRERFATAEVVA